MIRQSNGESSPDMGKQDEAKSKKKSNIRCSFCLKSLQDIEQMISGPSEISPKAYICDECVAVCNSIIADAREAVKKKIEVGGHKKLPARRDKPAVTIFYSYSHRDEYLRNKLEEHLSALKYEGLIRNWHDRKIQAGQVWESEIDDHLKGADVILLLVSSSFLASNYCYGREVMFALKRHTSGECRVIPVILKPVDWSHSPFAGLQGLPRDGKPVTSWSNREQAFLNITEGIRKAISERREM